MRGVVTIVVQPRERFSAAIKSLECLLARTSQQSTPYRLIYIDGGSPAPVAKALHRAADLHGFVLVRVEFFLTQHEAKNIALGHVRSRYYMRERPHKRCAVARCTRFHFHAMHGRDLLY